jgi:hypothetical protein
MGLEYLHRLALTKDSALRFWLLVSPPKTCVHCPSISQGKTMDNLSTASTDISSQIGALELGDHLESYGDGVLEASTTAGPVTYNCGWPTRTPACR